VFPLQLDLFDLAHKPAGVVGQEGGDGAEDGVTEAADVQNKPGGRDRPRPPGVIVYQSRFTTRSARPFSPSTTFSLPLVATRLV
jgi:hypothetical protein